ncbi:hypothetical protein HF320_05420 [Collinsella sp. KGMB02528]|uniref:Uncharacterized protein n=1 Tax=Collinsella acetigenes TaxID=2713419 RepID=A0A7X9UC30_9ACTN|nr:hypothetical protein [Collinsella acetigenes]NMF55765.1 hypothetical protein [Collinsella acetigenes]
MGVILRTPPPARIVIEICQVAAATGIAAGHAVLIQAFDDARKSAFGIHLARKESLVEVEVLKHLFKVAALGVVAGIGKNVVSFLAHLPCVGRILVFHVEIRQGCKFLSIDLLKLHDGPSFSNGTRPMPAALPLSVRARGDMGCISFRKRRRAQTTHGICAHLKHIANYSVP